MVRAKFLNARQRDELEQVVRRPSEDHGVGWRANAILLLDDGKSCIQIAEFLYLDDDTIRTWHRHYMPRGGDELEMFDWKGCKSFLNAGQEEQLCCWLEVCRDTNEIRAHIEKSFGVCYSHSGSIKLLHRLGFEYKKPKALPRVADEGEQQAFIDSYEDLLRRLPADEAVYFADAVHREYQVRPAYGWERIKRGHQDHQRQETGKYPRCFMS